EGGGGVGLPVLDHGGQLGEAGQLGGAPPPLPSDDRVPAGGLVVADADGLEEAHRAEGGGELFQESLVELLSGLVGVGVGPGDGDGLLGVGGAHVISLVVGGQRVASF